MAVNYVRKFKLFSLFIACLFLIQVSNIDVFALDKYLGDVNGDGVVSVSDARFVLQIAARLKPSSSKIIKLCDVDGDNAVTISDAVLVLRIACGVIELSPKEDINDIILSDMPEGSYILKYENEFGAISNYENICTLNVLNDNEDVLYDGFIPQNCAPADAKVIGLYSSDDEKVGEIPLDNLSVNNLGKKKYSFAALSDTHIGSKTSTDDLVSAFKYIEIQPDVEFTTICGDLSLGGTVENLTLYKTIVDENTTKPVYAISGNHETNAPFAPLATDSLKPYTGQDLYYHFEVGDDVFIMLGMYDVRDGHEFAEGELQWLYEVLEANRNKRCFLFTHLFPRDGSGDAVDLDLEGDMLNNTQGKVFYSLISHYSNVLYFHGHSHQKFELQAENQMNNYDNVFGCHSIHIPSLAYPKGIDNGVLVSDYNASEGYLIDVYENNIVLRGRDFVSGKFLPIATYCLNTQLENVDSNTYYDPTGTVMNENSTVLKSSAEWYNSEFDKSLITSISFVDEYSEKFDERWDATQAQNGRVIVYRKNTELFIECKNNLVTANVNSSEMFCGFESLCEIKGFSKFDTTEIVKIDSMFKGCKSLKELDLYSFKSVRPENMKSVFAECSSLEYLDISSFDLSKVNELQSMCDGCSSLEAIVLTDVNTSKTLYLTNTFRNCSSLEYMDMTKFSGNVYYGSTFSFCTSLKQVDFSYTIPVNMNNIFLSCSSLKYIDLSSFDLIQYVSMSQSFKNCVALETVVLDESFNVNNVTNMRSLFENCSSLVLDCSAWDTTNGKDLTNFNRGAPNVIAPILAIS